MPPVKMTRAEYQAKYGVAPGATSPAPVQTTPTAPATKPVTPTSSAPVKMTRAEYTAKYGAPPAVETPAPVQGGGVGDFLKGIVSAPLTIVARPFQAVAELAGASPEDVDKFSSGISGGLIAPVPKDFGDVKKDVGRAVQTVALGTGAPIAGGAAFGVGSSLERGNDLFSAQTALEAVLGGGAGKVLGLVGKPLLDVSGKVIGTITPQILKDVASKGAGAVDNFMARHEVVPAVAKPSIAKIPKAAEAVDTGINKLFKGGTTAVKDVVKSQYPKVAGENVAKHYEKTEVDRLMEPTKTPGATYKKATEVAKDAERRGVDLKKLAADNKIYASEHVEDGKFATQETVDALRDEAMSGGKEILRPSLEAASPSVPRTSISEIRNEILNRIKKTPDAKLSPEQKLSFAKKVMKEYGDDSVTARLYKDGYDLTNLYDSKLQTSSNLYKSPKGGGVQTISDSLTGKQKQIESQVFDTFLRKNAPKELGLDKYFKAQEGRFILADYLESLNNKKAPQTLFQKAVKKTAQLAGATGGASVAGPFGMFSGYQFGGLVADTFAKASNPIKVSFLKSIGKTEPEIYSIMKEYVNAKNPKDLQGIKDLISKVPRIGRSDTIFQGPTQGGKPFTPNSQGFKTTPIVETKRIFKGRQDNK